MNFIIRLEIRAFWFHFLSFTVGYFSSTSSFNPWQIWSKLQLMQCVSKHHHSRYSCLNQDGNCLLVKASGISIHQSWSCEDTNSLCEEGILSWDFRILRFHRVKIWLVVLRAVWKLKITLDLENGYGSYFMNFANVNGIRTNEWIVCVINLGVSRCIELYENKLEWHKLGKLNFLLTTTSSASTFTFTYFVKMRKVLKSFQENSKIHLERIQLTSTVTFMLSMISFLTSATSGDTWISSLSIKIFPVA